MGPIARQRAFTLIESLIVVAILGILMTISVSAYESYQRETRFSVAVADITLIEIAIRKFVVSDYQLPNSLAEAGVSNMRDPWGNEYQYLRIEGGDIKGKGKLRKDKSLNPINSDYDLYSMGEDGDSKTPFTAKASRDDIVRASNGAFIGLADDF
ncbi:MAG: prepilin-type N-terminal cleavage/methylation domain-containing protein [Congregibacter sp.]